MNRGGSQQMRHVVTAAEETDAPGNVRFQRPGANAFPVPLEIWRLPAVHVPDDVEGRIDTAAHDKSKGIEEQVHSLGRDDLADVDDSPGDALAGLPGDGPVRHGVVNHEAFL